MTSENVCKRTLDSFSAYQIKDSKSFDFCPEKYSKFKFGSFSTAREFGHILADGFIAKLKAQNYQGQQIVVIPSAYAHIPTASFYMKVNFVDKLNVYLYNCGYPVVEESKIYRTVTYREDYGEMSAAERYNLISGDRFYMDKQYVDGKLLVFIDDVKITGTHERIITKMLDEYQITNHCYMLYFAELADTNIPPTIENYLNFYYVKSLDDLDQIIKNDTFVFNSRIVKYILNSKEEDFDRFIKNQHELFRQQFYYNAIGNEYFKFPAYIRNLNILGAEIR